MWLNYSSAANDCRCFPFWPLRCDGKFVSVDSGQILTYDSRKELISSIMIRYEYLGGYNKTKTGHILLPDDISELNQYMCAPLNRKGYLCGECRSGYGPAAFLASCTNVCHFCRDTWHDIILYLSLEIIPVTVFYLLILIFQIQLTSAPMTCFIMYSQLIVLAFYQECASQSAPTLFSQVKFTYTEGITLRAGTKVLLTLYGMFNLDFFHYVLPPFCISSQLRPIHVAFLGYISAFYPFLLILLTWFCVELHGRNFRPIVCLWRPFHGCFVQLRRGWNTKSDLIDVFASFLLLSYSKIMYLVVLTTDSTEFDSYSLVDGHECEDGYVLSVDVSIVAKSATYSLILAINVLLSLIFIIFPASLLLLYPKGIFQKLLSKCTSNRFRIILHIFVEKFQSCYRDGLDDAKGIRSFSGFYFLLRITIYLAQLLNGFTLHFEGWLIRGFVFSVAALLIALCRPYKKTPMNIVDSIFLSHLATLCYIASSNYKSRFYLQLAQAAIGFPFVIFCLKVAYRMAHGVCKVHFLSRLLSLRFCKASQAKANDGLTSVDDRQQNVIIHSKTTYGTMISDLP